MTSPRDEATEVKDFDPASFAAKLRVPPGTRYVEARGTERVREALVAGRAVFVQSCDGRAFVWREGPAYLADHFFMGPPRKLRFETLDEAVDFAAGLCE